MTSRNLSVSVTQGYFPFSCGGPYTQEESAKHFQCRVFCHILSSRIQSLRCTAMWNSIPTFVFYVFFVANRMSGLPAMLSR
jgi:hypothetical protein